MSKAYDYIREHARTRVNHITENFPWITTNDAQKAVEIAREETYNKIWNWLAKHINDYVVEGNGRDIDLMFDDIKQAMKDE